MDVLSITPLEHVNEPVASRSEFVARISINFIVAALVVTVSLVVGMVGYHYLFGITWDAAFENASMILSGMGPVSPAPNWNARIFSGLYALYSGLVLVMTSGLILAPIAHRVLHKLHVQCD